MTNAFTRTPDASRMLILIRHGKAAPKDVGLTDFERTLTRQGAAECESVARKIAAKRLSIDLMISSPADRALETAHLFARHLKYPFERIQVIDAFYSSDTIVPMLSEVKRLPDSVRVIALFGHNPSFEEIVAYLVPGFSQSIPKGAVAGISLNAESWGNVRKGTGALQYLICPLERGEESSVPRSSIKQTRKMK